VHNIKKFITSQYNFQEEDMVVLTDDQDEERFIPTRENITAAMQWLVHDAQPDDSYDIFFFSKKKKKTNNIYLFLQF
jgi:hypothetical protein